MTECKKSLQKILFTSLAGNLFEWYDFSLYGFLAKTLSERFFSPTEGWSGLFLVYGIFALSFFARPVGAVLFGHYGDRYGRKKAFSFAMLLMCASTVMIGCLPTYDQWGAFASTSLILCRLLQGFALGGQFSGSMVYLLEHNQGKKRGFWSSLIMSTSDLGFVLGASIASFAMSVSTSHNAWRFPFLLGGVLALLGFYLRRKMPETPDHLRLQENQQIVQQPFLVFWREHRRKVVGAVCALAVPLSSFYITAVFLVMYFQKQLQMSEAQALKINSWMLLFSIAVAPLCGCLNDYLKSKRMFTISSALLLIFSPLLYYSLRHVEQPQLGLTLAAFTLFIQLSAVSIPTFLFELYPPQIRYTGLSLTYNLASGIIGGSSPLIAAFLLSRFGDIFYLSLYTVPLCALSLICLGVLRQKGEFANAADILR